MLFEIKGNYFAGNFSKVSSERFDRNFEKFSPANLGQKLWETSSSLKDIDNVLESSQEGYFNYRKTSIEERSTFLKKYQDVLKKRRNEIEKAISLETGKPLWEAKTEVNAVIAKIDVSIEFGLKRIQQQIYKDIMPGTEGEVNFKPIGPCLIIGPFNFPCHLANGQIVNALLGGNSIIFKPSEKTIYSGQLLIECLHEAGFPKGTINYIIGGPRISNKLVNDRIVKGVFFTGSEEVGRQIAESTAGQFSKLVALEMGGKNTSIIHSDADLVKCLPQLLMASYLTSGQRCVSTTKVAIHRSVMTEFIGKFHDKAKSIVIDHPIDFEEEPFMGPLIDQRSMDNYLNFMGMAIREGAEEIMRGKQLTKKFDGYYVTPSIHLMNGPIDNSHFIKSEIFGPNCTFIPYDDIEEAIAIANHGDYGLSAGVFTQDKSIFNKCISEIDVGVINLNRSTVGASSKLPFGGVKSSGNHRPAGISMIDACVYPIASLKIDTENDDVKWPIGISES